MQRIAIIGAGLSGITLANQLRGIADVTVFEKSRGFGGRMATRRFESYQFDHGAQFFTARSDEFQQFLSAHITDNLVWLWEPKVITLEAGRKRFKREWFEPHYVAVPGMNALCKKLSIGLQVKLHTEITEIQHSADGWQLKSADGQLFTDFDWVISSAPAPQTARLLPANFSEMARIENVSLSPCFCLMLGIDSETNFHFDAAVVHNSAIRWLAINSSKVERSSSLAVVVHSDNGWAADHLSDDESAVRKQLLAALEELLGDSMPQLDHVALQRWLYAKVETSAGADYLIDEARQLAACGEWCRGDRVEDAYLSGFSLGKRLAELL